MRRIPLALTSALVVMTSLSGCSSGAEHNSTATPKKAYISAGSSPTHVLARGADVDAFCRAAIEAGNAVDQADPRKPGDWSRIVAAYDALYALGVPNDYPDAGVEELDQFTAIVRRNSSVVGLAHDLDSEHPKTAAISHYLRRHCGDRYSY